MFDIFFGVFFALVAFSFVATIVIRIWILLIVKKLREEFEQQQIIQKKQYQQNLFRINEFLNQARQQQDNDHISGAMFMSSEPLINTDIIFDHSRPPQGQPSSSVDNVVEFPKKPTE